MSTADDVDVLMVELIKKPARIFVIAFDFVSDSKTHQLNACAICVLKNTEISSFLVNILNFSQQSLSFCHL
jgi:uncharacterized membrane protein YwzB